MKKLIFFFFLSVLLAQSLYPQTLQDIKDLEKLKKQLEETGKLPKEVERKIPEAASLETFESAVDTPKTVSTKKEKPEEAPEEKEEKAVAAEDEAAEKEPAPLPLFGFEVFSTADIDFTPEIYGPVDDNYPLGPGDEVIITVWGEVELRHELTINRQGQIFIPEVGLFNVQGLSMARLKQKLATIMGKSYSSITKNKAFLDVSLGKLRSIRVYVVGDVQSPGVFTVPALTPVFNMLFYAGGLKSSGSLRNIRLVRSDKTVAELDFYEFLTEGNKFSDIRLQTHDVLLVPTAKKLVTLRGTVKKEARYELSGDEGLTELISYAGGFRDNAYIDKISIQRYVNNKDLKLIDVNFRQLLAEGRNFPLQNGDRISVFPMDRDLKNFVTITGPIYGPTRFEYYRGMTISELFAMVDSIKGEAYLERVHITRILPDRKQRIFSINLKDFLENEDQDFLLAPEDQITIQSKSTLFPADYVNIYGAINSPGRYLLKEEMTLKDLIFAAGGFTKDALITEAEISRVNPKTTQPNKLATIIHVKIDSNYTKDLELQTGELFFLEPYDQVFIRTNSDWELQRNVSLTGEVERPGTYTIKNKTERITDIIERAGGLKPTAYLEGATLTRSKEGVGTIGIDFRKIFRNPGSEENIYLQNGDRIDIPERLATVKIVGGVHFPSSVLFENSKGLDYYIKAAGGYRELADKKNVTIRLANGRPVTQHRFLLWKYLSDDITAGSTIYVPLLAERESIDWSGAIRDAAAILSSVATTILIYDRLRD